MSLCTCRILFCLRRKQLILFPARESDMNQKPLVVSSKKISTTLPVVKTCNEYLTQMPREFLIDRESFIQDTSQEII